MPGASIPRKVAEKTILAEQDTTPDVVQLSKTVIDNIKATCSDEEIANESRRTLKPGWFGEAQTNPSPGGIRTVVEGAEMELNHTYPYPPCVKPSQQYHRVSPLSEVISHLEAVELLAVEEVVPVMSPVIRQ